MALEVGASIYFPVGPECLKHESNLVFNVYITLILFDRTVRAQIGHLRSHRLPRNRDSTIERQMAL
jgi:hypothetical protein